MYKSLKNNINLSKQKDKKKNDWTHLSNQSIKKNWKKKNKDLINQNVTSKLFGRTVGPNCNSTKSFDNELRSKQKGRCPIEANVTWNHLEYNQSFFSQDTGSWVAEFDRENGNFILSSSHLTHGKLNNLLEIFKSQVYTE